MSATSYIAPFVDGVSTAHLPLQKTYGWTGGMSREEMTLWRRAVKATYDAQPHWVYWHYDADGRLLYVGMTSDIEARTNQHRYTTRWWHAVERVVSTRFDDAHKARSVEQSAIESGRPLYNVKHNPDAELARERLAVLAA